MSEHFNYKMITLARESRGLTQKDLSSKIPSLNQGNLSKIERGQLNASIDLMRSIANTLNYPLSFFYQKEVLTPISNFYYRKRTSVSKRTISKFEAQVDIIRKSVDILTKDVEMEEFRFPQIEIGVHNKPKDAAIAVRQFLKIPKGPISDIITALENHGIIVYFIDADEEGIDGLTTFTDNARPIIFINQNYPNDRKRFTLSHELGHLVMHIPFVLEEWRDEELEANQFASEFLMPDLDCRADLHSFKFNRLADLKSYWRISKAAIIRRAYDLNFITYETYQYMIIELGRRGERKVEKGYVEIDEPKLLHEIINLHLADSSKHDLANVISLSERDFEDSFIHMGQKRLKLVVNNRVA